MTNFLREPLVTLVNADPRRLSELVADLSVPTLTTAPDGYVSGVNRIDGTAIPTFKASVIKQAIAAAAKRNRVIDSPWGPAPTWAVSTTYTGGRTVRGTGSDAANLYLCVGNTTAVADATQAAARTGVSASSGTGPTGTGSALITDGTAMWIYFGKATAIGTIPLYSTVVPAASTDVMDGFLAVIAVSTYATLGLTETIATSSNPKFRISGVLPAAFGVFNGANSNTAASPTRPSYYTRPVIEIVTNSDTWIAIRPQASMTQHLQLVGFEVNGQMLSESSFVSTVATGTNAFLLNLASFGAGNKHIRMMYKGANVTNGANLAYAIALPADTFAWPPVYANPVKIYVEADSLAQSSAIVGQIDPARHIETMIASQLGFSDAYNGAIGGTGIIANNGGKTNYADRLPDLIAYAPDIVYFGGIHNDNDSGSTTSAVKQAAFLAYFQAFRAALPHTPIIIVPYQVLRSENLTGFALTTENDLIAAVTAWGDTNCLVIPLLSAAQTRQLSSTGRFFQNTSPYIDQHPWPPYYMYFKDVVVNGIKDFFATK